MTFSIDAGGTRNETLASLEAITYGDGLGASIRDAIATCLREAASEGLEDGRQLRYTVEASGHSAPGQIPFLTVHLTGQYVQPPADPG